MLRQINLGQQRIFQQMNTMNNGIELNNNEIEALGRRLTQVETGQQDLRVGLHPIYRYHWELGHLNPGLA